MVLDFLGVPLRWHTYGTLHPQQGISLLLGVWLYHTLTTLRLFNLCTRDRSPVLQFYSTSRCSVLEALFSMTLHKGASFLSSRISRWLSSSFLLSDHSLVHSNIISLGLSAIFLTRWHPGCPPPNDFWAFLTLGLHIHRTRPACTAPLCIVLPSLLSAFETSPLRNYVAPHSEVRVGVKFPMTSQYFLRSSALKFVEARTLSTSLPRQ